MNTATNKLPTEEDLKLLSHWARVALAVRCARRVYPFFERWVGKVERYDARTQLSKLIRVLETAHESAIQGKPLFETYDFEVAYRAADAAHANGGVEGEAAFCAVDAVTVAAATTKVAFADSAFPTHTCILRSIAATIGGADGLESVLRRCIRRDYQVLLSMRNAAVHWCESTPVDPRLLGELWSDKVPEHNDSPALEVYFEPNAASQESLQRVMEALSKLHIAAGGGGLEFKPDDGYVHVRERVVA